VKSAWSRAHKSLASQRRGAGRSYSQAHADFRQDLMRAREIRGSFGEQILAIADNAADDWYHNEKTGKLSVNKEVVLRSRVRIEARQFHMSRLHPQQWREKQRIYIKNDWALLQNYVAD
jgi:hypothetical protein